MQKGVRVSAIEAALDQTKDEQAVSIVDNVSPVERSIIHDDDRLGKIKPNNEYFLVLAACHM